MGIQKTWNRQLGAHVSNLRVKWNKLFAYAASQPDKGLPINLTSLVKHYNEYKTLGVNKNSIYTVYNGSATGSLVLHSSIINLFLGPSAWPCAEYFDLEGNGRDQDIRQFINLVFPSERRKRFIPTTNSNRVMDFDPRYFSATLTHNDELTALGVEFVGRTYECIDLQSNYGTIPIGFYRLRESIIDVIAETDSESFFPGTSRNPREQELGEHELDVRIERSRSDLGHRWDVRVDGPAAETDRFVGATPLMHYNTPGDSDRLIVSVWSGIPAFTFNDKLIESGKKSEEDTKLELTKIFRAHLKNKIDRASTDPFERDETDFFEIFVQTYEPSHFEGEADDKSSLV